MFRNFWVGSDGEFVFYSHIYFSFFDCEVKLVFHVIMCHSYKFRTCSYMFVHVRICSYMFVHVRTCSYMFVHVRTWMTCALHPLPPSRDCLPQDPFNFRFLIKQKWMVGGGWKMIHKLTLSINRPKNLSNNLNFEEKYQFCWMKSPVQVTSRLLSELFNANVIF